MASKEELIALIIDASDAHDKYTRYSVDPDSGETIDYMGPLEFYFPVWHKAEFKGYSKNVGLNYVLGLGPSVEAAENLC